ncbi:GntR family transcriptional regulator [Glutamicibacter halophytocola]|uniref:GntR family transcriptional regulator n=1 Tax=Glutamicibacter halophytocola TaxID=1933880 RepID=A0AA94XRE6_9MICC|nr:GntR family transcriptional regulator [Glutamicibacter halophytocola]UUX58503.1 GntR family transcriptional regulator [Glutamicibacter halophytocola]
MNFAPQESLLSRSSGQPLHAQIRDILHQHIVDQSLVAGTPLPTEEELQKNFGVSRSVVRQALAGLAEERLIHRQRGRGSVVAAAPVLRRHIQQAGGLDQQAAASGQRMATHIHSIQRCTPPREAAKALGVADAWQIERVRSLDSVAVAFMRTWVPYGAFSDFSADLLENASLLSVMRERGFEPVGGPRSVQAVASDRMLAGVLQASVGEPLLLLRGVTRDASGMGLEWFNVWHSPNTIFDVDAQVAPAPSMTAGRISRLRQLASELEAELSQIDVETGGQ